VDRTRTCVGSHLSFRSFIDNVRQWTSHIEKTKTVRDQIHYKLLEEAEEMFAKGQQTESYIEYLLANQKALGVSRDEIA